METIFALASAAGKAGVSVIRVSGPDAFSVAGRLCVLPPPRHPAVRPLLDSAGDVIDEALVLCFDHGASFTGETVVELQVHGSPAIVRSVLKELSTETRARLAEPGEFTRRAFDNGRLNLTQVEGLGDLIEAETEAQRRQAMRVFEGAFSQIVEGWRKDLIHAAALLEATIDFADEEVPVDVSPEVLDLLTGVKQGIRDQLKGHRAAERVRNGFEVAILGRPNVGKSTLLNALVGREAAITSDVAGTTRDVIEAHLDVQGLAVTFLDTAGLRVSEDKVETIGIERAVQRAEGADLRIFLVEGDEDDLPMEPLGEDLIVRSKADLRSVDGLAVSGKTGAGVSVLMDRVADILKERASGASLVIRERHNLALQAGFEAIEDSMAYVAKGLDQTDLAAEELRSVVRGLESLIGHVGVEDVLDDVFSRFCLGK